MFLRSYSSTDYVGTDNDDVMRLVQVRDLLAGQGWFDLMQYRLGEHGVLMHWSRLIDLPLAVLILFFNTYFSMLFSEQLALIVWPMLLAAFFMQAMWAGSFRLGGRHAAIVAMILTIAFFPTNQRFDIGAIDHHNVQLMLVLLIAAMLLDPHMRPRQFFIAGFACAVAIAIGVETTPFIAIAIAIVAAIWAFYGKRARAGTVAFGLALTVCLSILFVATTAPDDLMTVACDSFSFAFWSLGSAAGLLLAAAALSLSELRLPARLGALAACGVLGLLLLMHVAPQCLAVPLADLDPLLRTYWLSYTTEAQSFFEHLRDYPQTQAMYYVPGLFAIIVCIVRIYKNSQRHSHLVLLALLGAAWCIALVQIRSAIFANALSILPLSAWIAGLRTRAADTPENVGSALRYYMALIAAFPILWGLGGMTVQSVFASGQTAAIIQNQTEMAVDSPQHSCTMEQSFKALRNLPPELIASTSDLGASILRYSEHRALSAPYHRNPDGMLAVIEAALAGGDDAHDIFLRYGASLFGFCPTDPQTLIFSRAAPNGFFARMLKGDVPRWLTPLPVEGEVPLRFYRIEKRPDMQPGPSVPE